MKTMSAAKFKEQCLSVLDRVGPEGVVITKRGRPVARLTPAVGAATLPHELVELAKQGLVKLGSGKLPKGFWDLPRPRDPKGRVVKAVLSEREQGR